VFPCTLKLPHATHVCFRAALLPSHTNFGCSSRGNSPLGFRRMRMVLASIPTPNLWSTLACLNDADVSGRIHERRRISRRRAGAASHFGDRLRTQGCRASWGVISVALLLEHRTLASDELCGGKPASVGDDGLNRLRVADVGPRVLAQQHKIGLTTLAYGAQANRRV